MLVSCLHGLTQPVKDLDESKTELDEIYEKIEDKEEMPKIIDLNRSPIYKFYENRTVLVTGATGYLGKTLIEKLLRACPIRKVFIVLRPKRNKSMEERAKQMFDSPLFDKMKERNPRWKEQVELVGGEAVKVNFGFSEETQEKLRSEVNLIFHQAATVRFDQEFEFSLRVNVVGTIELIEFAKSCPNLKAFVHVSTAYAHAYMFETEETYYPTPISIEEMFEYLNMKDERLKEIRKKEILSQWKIDCLYLLTKALAENYIRDNCQNLPIGIIKPSVVGVAYHEPYKFWTDSLGGITPAIIGFTMGVIHVSPVNKGPYIDKVPVDMCTNATIAVACDVNRIYKTIKTVKVPPVYNYASGEYNPLSFKEAMKMTTTYYPDCPSLYQIYYSFRLDTDSRLIFVIYDFIFHLVPAILADGYLTIRREKPRLLKLYSKVRKHGNLTFYFIKNRFLFDTKNSRSLWDSMTPEDKQLFFCDLRELDWPHYMQKYWNGVRVYLLKESMDNVEQAKEKYQRLKLLHYAITTLFIVGFGYLFFKISLAFENI